MGELLVGLLLFLSGIHLLAAGMAVAFGPRGRSMLQAATHSLVAAFVSGTVVTALLQSSSLVTAILVGMVQADLLDDRRAFGIVLGANVGTCVTVQVVVLQLDTVGMLLVLVAAPLLFSPKKALRNTAAVICGLGALFVGLELMKVGGSRLLISPRLAGAVFASASNPFLGILQGAALTALIQSSSAAIGLAIALAAAGTLPLQIPLVWMLGANIGTCATTLVAALGTRPAAKRVALMHLLYNVWSVFLVYPFIELLAVLLGRISSPVTIQVAVGHLLFNVITALLAMPLAGAFVWLAHKLCRGESR